MLPRYIVDVMVRESGDFVEAFRAAVEVGRPIHSVVFSERDLGWLIVGVKERNGDGGGRPIVGTM